MRRLLSVISAVIVMGLLAACSAGPPIKQTQVPIPADLLNGEPFKLTPGDHPPVVDVLALDDQMRAFVDQNVPDHLSDEGKVTRILEAILEDELQIGYNNFKTYTAQEAFYRREGNCLSFTNLFIALAREAGLDANYQEVEVPPNWEQQGDTYFYNRHINALVSLQYSGKKAVDFNMIEFDHDYPRQAITDKYALAQYYNNMSVHWLGQGQLDQAFLHVREAISLQPYAAYFWTNLGAIYSQADDKRRAEAAWLRALELDEGPSAMSNLARLYQRSGEMELSYWYAERAERHRKKNPYYLYELAQKAYNEGGYNAAIGLVKKSIRLREDEHEFHRLLGLAYTQRGDISRASKSFAQAQGYATDELDRKRYNDKLRMLVHVNH